ncbi:MAG TPA: sigma-54 dependent transcriptional regulator [Ferrovibrio sp.]|jgi:two-component system response regulator FlrC|uniref:sigma-54-dependent transcriptional regulator FlbD n=1 Tax=Ferrovibrio sp. TaxID=1917215 RepID=UPI002B4B4E7C|nr:sigma-54 dependent transcriptional regulator [Ferrovibrio sp.]HLT76272.1 sigma-54 dependent transcriptional regulator [Ferrovibrio sp.]
MRLIIIGTLNGQIGAATRIALQRGAKVSQVEDIEQALNALRAGRGADLAMIDVSLDVKHLVESLKLERINLPVVACGIGNDARAAVAAIRAGAKEYLPLPPEPDLIAAVLEAVTEDSHQMLFRDPSMGQVVKLAEQIAPSSASVLITGESGTGKEVMARFIHARSPRSDRPFVSVNCAAIPDTLLESELFGHEKGAFTGAVARRLGKFEEANGGTLLLDEISEMDVRLQAKLLRAIQEREIDRIGGSKPVKVDIRVIATSNRNLADEVAKGTFREDLLFRLNVVNLKLPPLRSRPADVELLATHFIKKYAEANGVPERPLAPETLDALRKAPWRGNVRELENTMHRAVLLATGAQIELGDIRLPDGTALADAVGGGAAAATGAAGEASAGSLVGRTVADVERDLIIDTLKHCLGNRTHAANILGISIRTLRNKLKQYTDEGLVIPAANEGTRATA